MCAQRERDGLLVNGGVLWRRREVLLENRQGKRNRHRRRGVQRNHSVTLIHLSR